MIRVFRSEIFTQQLSEDEAGQIAADFRQYKETGVPASYFGRDAPYDHPNTLPSVRAECVMHLHLDDGRQYWDARRPQYDHTSDDHLVYCRGFDEADCYLLMATLKPNAHTQARNNSIMANLATMAAKFRERY